MFKSIPFDARFRAVAYLLLSLFLISCQPRYDIIIRNGMLMDGLGGEAVLGDVAIKNGTIEAIGLALEGKADLEIDASEKIVSPGFIDLHAHLEPLSLYPDAKSHVMQGVTTALGGPDGGSPFPLGDYLDTLEASGIGMNVGYLVGHNTIRNHVMGLIDQAPLPEELKEMQKLISESMDDGAYGMSTGLKYLPGAFTETEEIISLAKVVSAKDGIYTSHLREEGLGLFEGVAEAIRIAREAKIRVILTHHKAIGAKMWGASEQTLRMVDEARAEGLDVMMDQYPYTASHTGISVVIPPWALEGNPYTNFQVRSEDPVIRDSIKAGIIFNLINDRGGNDLRRIQFSRFDWKPDFEGKTLHDLLVSEDIEPTIENGAEMIIDIQSHRGAQCIYHVIDSADVKRIMQHPYTMIASDGRLTQMGEGHPHPRAYGTFPRVLGYYAREEETLILPEAVRKMTSLPAMAMKLNDRGVLKEGYYADITIFDPDRIIDKATFEKPHAYPEGIEYVIINGVLAVDSGHFLEKLNGQVLRKQQHQGVN